MKNTITLFAFYISIYSLVAQSPQLDWIKSIGGIYDESVGSVTVDAFGNILYTGSFMGTIDFDPGTGVVNLSSTGASAPPYISLDVFISKLDVNGNFLWAKNLGTVANDGGTDIVTDAIGNIYIAGSFVGTGDFNPDAGTYNLNSQGDRDIFILKLDMNGDFIWAKSFGGTQADEVKSMAIDDTGNIYTIGEFRETVDFDPETGVYNLTSAGETDVFIAKYDTNGSFVWAKQLGNAGYDTGESIAIDSFGNAYITGGIWNVANYEIFISKIDENGSFVWTRQLGDSGVGLDTGYSITVDNVGNTYTIGQFQNTVDFDPGIGDHSLSGLNDIFILKLDTNGDFIWVKQFGGENGYGSGYDIIQDSNGDIYGTGRFANTVDFDPGTGVYNLSSEGNNFDIFVSKLTVNGDFVWAKQFGGEGIDSGVSIYSDLSGNLYTAGFFQDNADFDPGTGGETLTSSGGYDLFILKLGISTASVPQTKQKTMVIYPNPVQDKLSVNRDFISVDLFDITGKKISSFSYQDTPIDLSHVNEGVYILKILTDEGEFTNKIIKE